MDALAVGGQDGCRVIQILEGGAIFQNNALGINDYVTEINGRDMRGLTNLEAFNILRDVSANCDTVSIRFIPASAVQIHRLFNLERLGQSERPPLVPPVSAADGPGMTNHLDVPTHSWMKVGRVSLRRQPQEKAWGLELSDQMPENLRQMTSFPRTLAHPTWISNIATDSPADRCGSLRPGDLILQPSGNVQSNGEQDDSDPLMNGPSSIAANRQSRSAHELSPESSQMDTPEPLTELESRDELNVLTRSIPSPVHRNGGQTDSGEEGGRTALDDQGPVVSVACPVIRDETTLMSGRAALTPLKLTNGTLTNGGMVSPLPPPLPPRRFSRETKPVPDEIDQQIPIATGDPVTLYTRAYLPGDEIIVFDLPLTDGSQLVSDGTVTPTELVTTPCKVENLGIRLVGSRMPEKVATYIGGFCPGSIAAKYGVLNVGDEIVQVSEFSVVGLSRLTVRRCLARAIAKSVTKWQTNGSDPTSPALLHLVLRRNPVHAEMMASTHSSPERERGSFSNDQLSPPVVPSRAAVSGSAFAEHTAGQIGFPDATNLVHRYPVAPEVVKQIATRLNESLFDLDVFDVELQRIPSSLVRRYFLSSQDKDGFGIFIVNLGPNDVPGVFVSALAPNGAAAEQGELQTHDRILAVNGTVPEDYDSTLHLLKQSDTKVRLTVGRQMHASDTGHPSAPVASSSPTPNAPGTAALPPLPQSIIPGVKTLVELRREPNTTFGFSVVGGKDTMLGDILIHEVHTNGVAARDGRLCTGDRLLAVNGVSLVEADHTTALQESVGQVEIKVERTPASRRPPYPPALPYYRLNVFTVVLQRPSPHTSQLSVTGAPDKPPELGFSEPLLGPSNVDASFGLFVREARPEEIQDAGGRLIVEEIKPGSPADLSAMILVSLLFLVNPTDAVQVIL
ncbi:unnamed protein product [Echinostoma caproni]|uniref:PDZ domain-containing protein n=1 Tax=Echinostoma caproni TaxID=27848 RepID=A0A3P8FAR6_9TREM|nr:unnamed protein product [Echinostoma caproni]